MEPQITDNLIVLYSQQLELVAKLKAMLLEQSGQIDALSEHLINIKRRVVALEKRVTLEHPGI